MADPSENDSVDNFCEFRVPILSPKGKKNALSLSQGILCGMDGTRTRDLLRDRQAF